jgi:hypothetical protein
MRPKFGEEQPLHCVGSAKGQQGPGREHTPCHKVGKLATPKFEEGVDNGEIGKRPNKVHKSLDTQGGHQVMHRLG